ncbi:hypothetical protein QE152_g5027 [Popillia japonica]|uniref:Transposase n=1 Tax=Popillia japonica TaxID=7064 RepID=A0AAW1MYB4_POPJA
MNVIQRDIAKECKVSLGAVNKILKLNRDTGTIEVNRKGKCGRKRKTTPRDEAFIIRESKLNPRKKSQQQRQAVRPSKKQLLTVPMMKKRYVWAKKYATWIVVHCRKVLFSDESHFFVQEQRSCYVRKRVNEKFATAHIDQTVKHPLKKMFWGCFSYNGTGSLVAIEGMINSQKYKDLLVRTLEAELSFSTRLCPLSCVQDDDETFQGLTDIMP